MRTKYIQKAVEELVGQSLPGHTQIGDVVEKITALDAQFDQFKIASTDPDKARLALLIASVALTKLCSELCDSLETSGDQAVVLDEAIADRLIELVPKQTLALFGPAGPRRVVETVLRVRRECRLH